MRIFARGFSWCFFLCGDTHRGDVLQVRRLGGGRGCNIFVPVLRGHGTKISPTGDRFDQPPGEMRCIWGTLADHRESCSLIPGRGCFDDLPGDEIVVSPASLIFSIINVVHGFFCGLLRSVMFGLHSIFESLLNMVLECFLLLYLSVFLVRSLGIRILYEYYFMRKVFKLFRVVVWIAFIFIDLCL